MHKLNEIEKKYADDLLASADAGIIMHSYDMRDYKNVFSYKITDFIKLKKPVFYIGPKSDISEFVSNNCIGESINGINDPSAVADRIDEFIKKKYSYSDNVVKRFDISNLRRFIN